MIDGTIHLCFCRDVADDQVLYVTGPISGGQDEFRQAYFSSFFPNYPRSLPKGIFKWGVPRERSKQHQCSSKVGLFSLATLGVLRTREKPKGIRSRMAPNNTMYLLLASLYLLRKNFFFLHAKILLIHDKNLTLSKGKKKGGKSKRRKQSPSYF